MSSSEYVRTAKRLINEHPDLFEALLEFERTKRMPKLSRKRRVNVTLDEDLLREFKREAKNHGAKLSGVLELGLAQAFSQAPRLLGVTLTLGRHPRPDPLEIAPRVLELAAQLHGAQTPCPDHAVLHE